MMHGIDMHLAARISGVTYSLSQNGMILKMQHNDVLGKMIKIRDIVFRLSKDRVCVEPCIVTSLTRYKVILNDGLQCDPNRVVVVTEQIQHNGKDLWTNQLEFKYRENIIKGIAKLDN
jgi:hypothetical protein